MTRQTQQFKLYAAERAVSQGRSFESIDEIQSFVDGLRETLVWMTQGYWVVSRIEVGRPSPAKEKGGSVGWFEKHNEAGRIEMAKVHWNELTVLHEVSHVLAEAKHGSKSHDPYFARIYCTLVYQVMGSKVWLELQQSFDAHGIKYLQEG